MTFKQIISYALLMLSAGSPAAAPIKVIAIHAAAVADPVHIRYGANNEIVYDLQHGTLTVRNNGRAIFTGVDASVALLNDTLRSTGYTSRRYETTPVNDDPGMSQKHIITLTAPGKPEMQQIFYTSPGKNYFLTQVSVAGHQLASGYMSPFRGKCIPVSTAARTLFVPFDNDTFVSYRSMLLQDATAKNISAEVNMLYDDVTRQGLIAGSVEHGTWKTGVCFLAAARGGSIHIWAGYSDLAVTRDEIAHGSVKGDVIKSPKMMIGYFSDWRDGMEAYGGVNRIEDAPYVTNWTKATPLGWNSWGVMQEKITYEKALKVVDFFADSLKGFRSGGTAYIDLDSYWDKLVHGQDYHLLKQFADYCKAKGLQPGVYWAPFTDWGHKDGPDRKVEGSDYTYGQLWTKAGAGYHDIDGARALDPTHPGTLKRIDHFTAIFKACGFKMIKIDFLGHGAAESDHFYDTSVTTGMQAYRKGMEYLVGRLDGMFIYAAISPSLATGRYVHSRRIACDAFMTMAHTQYTLNSVTYGWWQTFLYNYLDADHVVLDHRSEGENRARMLSAVITGTWITGDDFSVDGPWSGRARAWCQNRELLKITQNGRAFRPVATAIDKGSAQLFTRRIGKNFYLAVFNYGKISKKYHISFRDLNMPAGCRLISNLIDGRAFRGSDAFNVQLAAADAAIYKLSY